MPAKCYVSITHKSGIWFLMYTGKVLKINFYEIMYSQHKV